MYLIIRHKLIIHAERNKKSCFACCVPDISYNLFYFIVNLTESQKKWLIEYFQKLCSSGLTESKNKVNHFQVFITI